MVPRTFDEYYNLAATTYYWVLSKMTVGRGNKNWLGQLLNPEAAECVNQIRKEYAGWVKKLGGQTLKIIEVKAWYAQERGSGNCEEYSAVTFNRLKKQGVYPLDWMQQAGWGGGEIGNHAFVVIGLDPDSDATDISTWNSEVVWCDPYEEELGGLKEIKDRFEGKTIWSRFRWDGK
jgi:hypothetical protein